MPRTRTRATTIDLPGGALAFRHLLEQLVDSWLEVRKSGVSRNSVARMHGHFSVRCENDGASLRGQQNPDDLDAVGQVPRCLAAKGCLVLELPLHFYREHRSGTSVLALARSSIS